MMGARANRIQDCVLMGTVGRGYRRSDGVTAWLPEGSLVDVRLDSNGPPNVRLLRPVVSRDLRRRGARTWLAVHRVAYDDHARRSVEGLVMEIRPAKTSSEVESARRLFVDYQTELGIDLCFQGFTQELATLPGDYASPRGILLVAWEDGSAHGCVAVRSLEQPGIAELKRLYVCPRARGRGLGERLARAAVSFARQVGYERVRLDTLPSMARAQALYRSLGFVAIEPYRDNPVPGATYMELGLRYESDTNPPH